MGIPCNLTGGWLFLCEQHYWGLVHVLIPGRVFYIVRNYWVTMFWLLVWEGIEVLISAISGSLDIFANSATPDGAVTAAETESIYDSILGDLFIMGQLGILLVYLLVKITDSPRLIHPSKRRWWLYIKYLIELGLFAAPTPGVQVYIGDSFISIGWLVLLVWFPLWTILSEMWNDKDPVYQGTEHELITGKPLPPPQTQAEVESSYYIAKIRPLAYMPEGTYVGRGFNYILTSWRHTDGHHSRSAAVFAIVYFLLILSLIYPYFESLFIETLIHVGATILILCVVLYNLTKPRFPRSDTYIFNF